MSYKTITPSTPQKFWDRVTVQGDCWIWEGSAYRHGYGIFRNQSASRLAYVELKGPIPKGKRLSPTCENRACVNPDHFTIINREERLDPQRPGYGVSWHPQARMWAVVVSGTYVGIYEDEQIAYRAVIAHRKAQGTMSDKHAQLAEEFGLPDETPEEFFQAHPTRRQDADKKPRHRGLGISWCKQTNRWQAKVNTDGKQKQLGRFPKESDAYRAALAFLIESGAGSSAKADKLKQAIKDTEEQ